jgi:hypothetical protein
MNEQEGYRSRVITVEEQHLDIPYSPKLTDTKGRVITGAMNALSSKFISPGIENILVKTDIEHAPDFGDKLIRAVQAGYEVPILYPSHLRISDAHFVRDPARIIKATINEHLPAERRIEAWAEILAASLHYGQQGPWRTGFYNGTSKNFEKGDIKPFLIVRPQDRDRYREELEDYYNPIQEGQDLIEAIKKNHAIIVHPEGTTVGDEMTIFMPGSVFRTIQAVEAAGKKALVIPVSKTGSRKIESGRKLPTLIGLASMINLYNKHITGVYLHEPMPYDQGELGELYRAGKKTKINELIGGIVASRLPEEERGAYAQHVREQVIFPDES